MCFVPDRYMLVAAESGTYSVKVNVRKMLKSNEQKKTGTTSTSALEKQDENLSNENVLDFMTSTKSDDSKLINPQLVAQPVVIEAVSRKQQVVEKKFTSNSLIFANDLLCNFFRTFIIFINLLLLIIFEPLSLSL